MSVLASSDIATNNINIHYYRTEKTAQTRSVAVARAACTASPTPGCAGRAW